jgi:hypothetical protein
VVFEDDFRVLASGLSPDGKRLALLRIIQLLSLNPSALTPFLANGVVDQN